MFKRIFEIILGVIITMFLLGSYGDGHNPRKLLIEYITTNGLLQVFTAVVLVLLASRLIAGKPKDYSKTFYKLFVKLSRNFKKKNKNDA